MTQPKHCKIKQAMELIKIELHDEWELNGYGDKGSIYPTRMDGWKLKNQEMMLLKQ